MATTRIASVNDLMLAALADIEVGRLVARDAIGKAFVPRFTTS